jgi:hypothetical protein
MCPLLAKARLPKTMAVNPVSTVVHSTMLNADTVPSANAGEKECHPDECDDDGDAPYDADAKKYHGDFPDSECRPVWLNATDK